MKYEKLKTLARIACAKETTSHAPQREKEWAKKALADFHAALHPALFLELMEELEKTKLNSKPCSARKAKGWMNE